MQHTVVVVKSGDDARGVKLVLKQKQGENIESLRQNKNIQVASGSVGLEGKEMENPMTFLLKLLLL